ncbi:Y-family DNA polymerase [Gloeobacter kilaueensis]|uniref:DNA-directed DNA polymerase n=1 Tax=Gloeobacter kilaueensis (strain ATCC BAA-2537 / CCAP 1431/1 / ULC 316 / JS1) TaxID=1183438 RepID=U5QMC4_GLOK1|nr:Y-family DNA polymerase [Gloeobacter kilaueensis]AGY60038.1 DNA-directed DNA polymerase [Gloeobacter kilaueensis JS1]
MLRTFALVDCNSFYAACEAVFEPRLATVPLVVLSNNDGCVIALNAAAKQLGIVRGVPFFRIRKLIRTAGLQVRSSNFELYGDMSRRVVACLRQFSSAIEVYSIDEVFLRLEVEPEKLTALLSLIRRTIARWTGIEVSIGAGRTKTLAKAANWLIKQDLIDVGVLALLEERAEKQLLERLPVGKVWGIGPRWARLLAERGCPTALQLSELPDGWVRARMSVVALRTVLELRGESCLPLSTRPAARKSIVVSRSFALPLTDLELLQEAVATFAARAAGKLRREQLVAGELGVFVQSDRFEPNFYTNSISCSLTCAANDTRLLQRQALALIETLWREGVEFVKAGVVLSNLHDQNTVQLSLFGDVEVEEDRRLMSTLDALNARHGPGSVRFAVEGTRQSWRGRSRFCSPRWSTRWGELPTATASGSCLLFGGHDLPPQQRFS